MSSEPVPPKSQGYQLRPCFSVIVIRFVKFDKPDFSEFLYSNNRIQLYFIIKHLWMHRNDGYVAGYE